MQYASWFTRVGGYIVDALVTLPFVALAFILDRPAVDAATGQVTGGGAIYWILLVAGVVVSAYNRWFLAGKTGQSWGRKAVGTRLVSEATGQPIGAGMAFARDLAHILDGLPCYIGWLFPLWDAKRQTFADKIVKTVVVS